MPRRQIGLILLDLYFGRIEDLRTFERDKRINRPYHPLVVIDN